MNRLLAKALGVAQGGPQLRVRRLPHVRPTHLQREVELDERGWLPPPLGQAFMLGQLLPVRDIGPWRGVSARDWVARFRVPTDSPVSDDEVVW